MTLLDIGNAGAFSESSTFLHGLGVLLKLGLALVFVFILTIFGYLGSLALGIYKGYKTKSISHGGKTTVHGIGYVMGGGAMVITLTVLSIFFSLSFFKVLLISLLTGLLVAYLARETFYFFALKKFGRFVMVLSALQFIKDLIKTNHGEQEIQQ